MNDKVKKYVLPNLPYLFIFWLADKLGQAFRLSAGENMGNQVIFKPAERGLQDTL